MSATVLAAKVKVYSVAYSSPLYWKVITLPLTAGVSSCVPSVATVPSAIFTFSSKLSTILPVAEAPIALLAGTVETSTGATPSSTSFGVPVMKNIANVLPSLAEAEPSTFEVLSAIIRIKRSFWLLAASGSVSLNEAAAFAPSIVMLPNLVQFSPSVENSALYFW